MNRIANHQTTQPNKEPHMGKWVERAAVVEFVTGTIELEQRPVFCGNRMGYESRTVTRNKDGAVSKVGEWQPPLCWLEFHESKYVQKPFWARLFARLTIV